MTLVVQFVEQPPPIKIVPSFDVQGRLSSLSEEDSEEEDQNDDDATVQW
jgi:hypothetical protein